MTGGKDMFFRRVKGGSALTAAAFAAAQALRLISNLVLTRLLFPEAFGIMALVSVVLVGLAMFSDIGIGPAISQDKDGDREEFLNTAFTINVMRGFLLCGLTAAAAWPLAAFYAAPELRGLLPAAGLTLLIAGFSPTRIDTANRHLALGRVTALDLLSQVIGMVVMILLAAALQSVWALVLGAIAGALARLLLMDRFLPGPRNRFQWDKASAARLVHFGKWIFLSTACGFLLAQGDKAILGRWLSLADLGIYNIGYFLASFPVLLAGAVSARVMIPLYRDRHPSASPANARHLRRFRLGITGGTLALLAVAGALAGPVIGLLYDTRYIGAAPIMAALALAQMPGVIGLTYDQSALAAGNSRGYFAVMALRAGLQTAAFMAGAAFGGVFGAIAGLGLSGLLGLPALAALARRHRAWDGAHDLGFLGVTLGLAALVLWTNPVLLTLVSR